MFSICMATYNEFDNLFWTIEMIRIYGGVPDVQFVVCNNDPNSRQGKAITKYLARIPNAKEVFCDVVGTAAPRNKAIASADYEWKLCMDCHVALLPGVAKRLAEWVKSDEAEKLKLDLFHGPLKYTHAESYATHFSEKWNAAMLGQWQTDNDMLKDDTPKPITNMGMGLFLVKDWLGFEEENRGFGGEEGVIQKKYFKHGRNVWLLPFLKWNHKFERYEVPHSVRNKDKFRNYMIGYVKNDLDPTECKKHFGGILSKAEYQSVIDKVQSIFPK